jgi:hypothetical protein
MVKRLQATGSTIRDAAQTMARSQRTAESAGIVFIEEDSEKDPGASGCADPSRSHKRGVATSREP